MYNLLNFIIMLHVSYKNRIGYYTKTEKHGDEIITYKNWLCHANCLWADMYFYKVSEDHEEYGKTYKKGDNMAQLVGFFANTSHLNRCLKSKIYEGCDHFHFYIEEMNKEIWTAIRLLVKAKKKVTIESRGN